MNASGFPQSIRAKQSQSSNFAKDIQTQNISASTTSRWRTILQMIFIDSVKLTDKMSVQANRFYIVARKVKLPAKKIKACGRTE